MDSDNGFNSFYSENNEKVEWLDGGWQVEFQPLALAVQDGQVEVIGNVWENPELIKE